MSIKRTIITAIVGLTLVALVAPLGNVAQGVTIDELLAQIAQLSAQLNSLQGNTGATPVPTGIVACAGVTFTRNLTIGSTGQDVKCLQVLLNTNGYTLAASGAGSPGMETSYFGSRTLAVVKQFQAAKGMVPANQVGPLTRAALNALLGSGTYVPPVTTLPAGCTSTSGFSPTTGASCATGVVVITPTGAGLTVQLASNNPAANTIVDGQAQAPLAKITFTNGDSSEVTVTGLKLKRYGISADASLTNVYLFNGATRISDGAAVSSTIVNFNNSSGLFKIPAGGSVTISVNSDVDGTSGETVGVQVVASTDVTTNASSVKGSFPVTGNLMTIATGTLAGVNFAATTTPADATIDPQNDYIVWQNSVTITTREVDMSRISFRKTGSVKDADLQNFRLFVDGVQVGSAVPNITLSSNSESLVTFDLSASPKRLAAGTRVIKLMADVIGGSSLTFQFHLWNVADATFVDSQYGANVLPQANSTTFSKRSAGTSGQTVGTGTLTVTKKSDSPSGNIVNGASNAILARFELKAAGEKVKIETLYVSANVNTAGVSGLRNGALYANGIQIGSTTTLYDPADSSYDYTTFNLGSSLIVEPGNPVTLEVRADVYDTGTSDTTNSIVVNSTIQVTLEGAASNNNATGQVSATTIDVPSADISGNSLTVKEGGLSLSADPAYTAQTAVAPVTAYKLADFNLVANTTEAVNISAINVTLDDVSSYVTNLYVKYGTKTTSVKSSITAALNTWSINELLAAGTTLPIEVYADVSSGMTSGTGVVTVDVDGTTANSAATADSTSVGGQTINFSSATFATAFASTPQSQAVSGSSSVEVGRFRFSADYQAYTIQELKIDPDVASTASSNAEDAIVSLTLKDGATVIATESFNNIDTNGSTGGYYFTGLSVPVLAGIPKTLTVIANLTIPSATAGNDGLRFVPALTYVKYMDPQGAVAEDTTERDANSTYVYKAVPAISLASTSTNNSFTNGQVTDLYKFRVTAPTQGDVSVKQFRLALSWSDAVTADPLELESLKLLKDGVDITDSVLLHGDATGVTAESTSGVTEQDSYIIVTWDGATEDTISAGESSTYTIRGTPQGFVVTSGTDVTHDSVSLTFTPDAAAVTYGSTSVDYTGYINTDDATDGILALYTSATPSSSAEEANLIWSDRSAISHSASTTAGTGDWTNSYLIKDSLSSVTWTK